MRVEVIGDATLYLGDCREVLPGLGKVDHTFTDPPYEAEAHTAMRRTNRSIRTGAKAELDFAAITPELRRFLAAFVARQNRGWSLIFCQAEAIQLWREAVESAGGRYRRAMAWVKPDSSPQFNGQGPAQGWEAIVASWAGDGASRWNGGGRRGVFDVPCNVGRFGGHPTEKPVALMRDLVSLFSNPGDVICDPFMGSGTTGVAALDLGRRFVGVEAKVEYFDLACRRVELAHKQPRLFGEAPPTKPVQPSLLGDVA